MFADVNANLWYLVNHLEFGWIVFLFIAMISSHGTYSLVPIATIHIWIFQFMFGN